VGMAARKKGYRLRWRRGIMECLWGMEVHVRKDQAARHRQTHPTFASHFRLLFRLESCPNWILTERQTCELS
jgi:hypothetical protein